MSGYSVAQTARLVCALRWTCDRLSKMLGAWAEQAAAALAHAEAAIELSELSRRLAAHREVLDRLQPDSELMVPWRQAAPADAALDAALDQIAALEGSPDHLDIAHGVLVPEFLRVYAAICEHATPHCDGALISAACSLRFDLDRECGGEPSDSTPENDVERSLPIAGGEPSDSTLEKAVERSLPAAGGGPSGGGAVNDAQQVLAAAGGIVAASVLRPDTWP